MNEAKTIQSPFITPSKTRRTRSSPFVLPALIPQLRTVYVFHCRYLDPSTGQRCLLYERIVANCRGCAQTIESLRLLLTCLISNAIQATHTAGVHHFYVLILNCVVQSVRVGDVHSFAIGLVLFDNIHLNDLGLKHATNPELL